MVAYIVAGVCTVQLLVFATVEALLRGEMMDSSAVLQQAIQSDSVLAKLFFRLIGSLSLVVTALVQAVVYYCYSQALGLTFILVTSLGVSLPNLLKLAYSDPRPYWAYDEVEALSCGKGWGNPSGHALFTGAVWLSLCIVLLRQKRLGWTGLVLLWLLLIGVDRVYLGVHFYSQVLLGWSYALGLVGWCWQSLNRPDTQEKTTLPRLAVWHLISALFLLTASILYALRTPEWDQSWSDRILLKCNFPYSASEAASAVFLETAVIAFFPGALLGVHLSQQLFPRLDLSLLPRRTRSVLCLASLFPLGFEGITSKGYSVFLCKRYLLEAEWLAWGLSLVGAYAAGVVFTAAVPRALPALSPDHRALAKAGMD